MVDEVVGDRTDEVVGMRTSELSVLSDETKLESLATSGVAVAEASGRTGQRCPVVTSPANWTGVLSAAKTEATGARTVRAVPACGLRVTADAGPASNANAKVPPAAWRSSCCNHPGPNSRGAAFGTWLFLSAGVDRRFGETLARFVLLRARRRLTTEATIETNSHSAKTALARRRARSASSIGVR